MLDPWEHVVGMGLGAVFANQLVKWDVKLKEDLDVMLAKARAANERRYFGIYYPLLVFGLSASQILLFFRKIGDVFGVWNGCNGNWILRNETSLKV